jgi:hypothetical protein
MRWSSPRPGGTGKAARPAWRGCWGLTVTDPGGASVKGPVLTWSTASMGPGASVTFTVTAQVGARVHDTVLVAAGALSATPDPDLFNNAAVAKMRLG